MIAMTTVPVRRRDEVFGSNVTTGPIADRPFAITRP